MPRIKIEEYTDKDNGVTYSIDKIGEAVERWIAWAGQRPSKTSKHPSMYRWDLDGIMISLEKLAHGYLISARCSNFSGIQRNLVTITPPFNVDSVSRDPNPSMERLIYEIKNIPNIQETKKESKNDDFLPKGEAPSILVKNITFNTVKGITTVIFDDDTKVMTKTTEGEEFDPEIGLAMCIAKKLYGSRTNFMRVVNLAMDKSAKGNKKREEKLKKKAEKAEAIKQHAKAQLESYME